LGDASFLQEVGGALILISTSHALEKLGKHYGAEHCITHPNLQPDFLVMAIIKSALATVHMPDLEVVLME